MFLAGEPGPAPPGVWILGVPQASTHNGAAFPGGRAETRVGPGGGPAGAPLPAADSMKSSLDMTRRRAATGSCLASVAPIWDAERVRVTRDKAQHRTCTIGSEVLFELYGNVVQAFSVHCVQPGLICPTVLQ